MDQRAKSVKNGTGSEAGSSKAFQVPVGEAMKAEMGGVRAGVKEVREGVETLKAGVMELSMRAGDLQQRICGLETAIEGAMRAYEANLCRILAVFAHTIERDLFTRPGLE